VLYCTGTQSDGIFGFSISILWGDTLFDWFHYSIQLQIIYNPVSQYCHAFLCGNQFILVTIVLHCTGTQKYLLFDFGISNSGETPCLIHFITASSYKYNTIKIYTVVMQLLNNIVGRHLVWFISLQHPATNQLQSTFTRLPCIYYVEISLYLFPLCSTVLALNNIWYLDSAF